MGRSKKNPRKESSGKSSREPVEGRERSVPPPARTGASVKASAEKPAARKRGWRDIEAMTERARLKSLLVDIWHEDIDLEEDIFGETDHQKGFYTDFEEIQVEIEPDDVDDDFEDEED